MGNFFLNLFTGGLVGEVKDGLLRAQQQYLAAEGDKEKLLAEQNMKYWQGRMDLAIANSQHGKWWHTINLMGIISIIYFGKIVVWDTVLGWGVTEDPGDQVTFFVMTVLGFFTASKSVEIITDKIAGAIARR